MQNSEGVKMGVSKQQSTPNFQKQTSLTLWYANVPPETNTYVCVSEGKKCSFIGKFGMLCFLETPVLRFALLPITDDTTRFLEKSLARLKLLSKKRGDRVTPKTVGFY